MGPRQVLLALLSGVHWAAFVVVFLRSRRATALLPVGVFTLLVLTQVLWNSGISIPLGSHGVVPLRVLLRGSAWVLAVPSLGLMFRRIYLRLKSGRLSPPRAATADASAD